MKHPSPHPRPRTPKHPRAAAATEYLAILALVVIPLALVVNRTVLWISNESTDTDTSLQRNNTTLIPAYEHRITSTIILPIG